ncbi:tetratricopeptide repeat protein [bacterium]|nr:tetratricopeptide repeat protein [bacterium]
MPGTGSSRAPEFFTSFFPIAAIATLFAFMAVGCAHKSSVDDLLAAGDQAMQNTKLADAESDYTQAASLAPNDPRPHIALGNLYVFEQKPSQAETEYIKVLQLDPRNAPAHSALASLYAGQSKLGAAEDQYRAAVAIAPTNAAYRIDLGSLLQRANKLDQAEAQLRTAVGLEPKNAHAHLALGKLFSAMPGRGDEAQAEFDQVRAIDPSLLPAAPPAPAPSPNSAASPAAGLGAPAPATPAATAKVRPLNRRFLLTHNSPVYETPDESATVVAQVHRGKFVHVTGITGQWFRIQLRNGTVGFIPLSAAE